jgi:hypothetical protein
LLILQNVAIVPVALISAEVEASKGVGAIKEMAKAVFRKFMQKLQGPFLFYW